MVCAFSGCRPAGARRPPAANDVARRLADDWKRSNGDGAGEPVTGGRKPDAGAPAAIEVPQTGDEFDTPALGLQWQWAANHQPQWWDLQARPGWLRLNAVPTPSSRFASGRSKPASAEIPGPGFPRKRAHRFPFDGSGRLCGIVVFGMDYSYLALFASDDGRLYAVRSTCKGADQGGKALDEATAPVGAQGPVELQLEVAEGGVCRFSLSTDGKAFKEIGNAFTARKGAWVGARIGLFVSSIPGRPDAGYADVDWFRIERLRSDPDTKTGERPRMYSLRALLLPREDDLAGVWNRGHDLISLSIAAGVVKLFLTIATAVPGILQIRPRLQQPEKARADQDLGVMRIHELVGFPGRNVQARPVSGPRMRMGERPR